MKNIFRLFILFSTIFFNGCEKDKPIPSSSTNSSTCWEQLVGNYIVYDTANSITYNMSIIHKDSIAPGYEPIDSLIINNYGNRFNLRVSYGCYTTPNLLKFVAPYPSYDHLGKRWSLWINDDDSVTTKYENQLVNDTIILSFEVDNIAFYFPDGVSYYSANEKHIAVKQ